MSNEPLDLDALAKLAEQAGFEETYRIKHAFDNDAWIRLGNYGAHKLFSLDDVEDLSKLLRALPRLIELARIGQQVGMLEDGEEIAIIKPPQEAEQWSIDVDDI